MTKQSLHINIQLALIIVSLLSIVSPSLAQVVAEAKMDTSTILIGEQVRVCVQCSVNRNQKVIFPYFQPQQELTHGVEVVNNGGIDTLRLNDGKRIQFSRYYTITSFDSAVYKIPPFQIKVDGKVYATRGSLGLKVNTVEVDTTHVEKFNGPHDVIDQPFEWSWQMLLLALIALAALCVVFALSIRLSDPRLITRRVVIHPPVPAHVTAIENIDHIKKNPTPDSKQYYMELTSTLRTYIEKRFGFSAREMTTAEIIDHLSQSGNEEAISELQSVLITADLVKFAKHTPSLPEQDRNLVQALDYVQTTKLQPQQLPQPRVEYQSLSNKQQILWRNIMRVLLVLLTALFIVLTAYNLWLAYSTFA